MSSAAPNAPISISVLRTLHRIHRQLTDLRGRLARGPKQIAAAEANVQRCDGALAQIKTASKSLRMAVDQKQLQLKSIEDKIKDIRIKLNAASTNREYQAFLEQIAADEMAKSVLEDEILDVMEQSDAFLKNIADAEASLAAAKAKVAEVHATVAEQEPSLRSDIARLEAELKKEEAALPEDMCDMYQRVVRQKGEDALAAVENQFCTGCNQQVTLNLYSYIMLGKPMFCKNCGRLLYLPESAVSVDTASKGQ
jgi:predicted  nucleic acid-binding Zn-ribbon protein